jgi:serine/threonine protein kinase
MSLEANTKLGRYEIRSAIGAGGMGEVYRARDTQLGRDVAVKVLPASYSFDQERLRRFEQEACAASALNHPNIISIYDVGKHDGSSESVELRWPRNARSNMHCRLRMASPQHTRKESSIAISNPTTSSSRTMAV